MTKLSAALQVSPQDLFVSSTTAQADLGALAFSPDGRAFRYAYAGATALVAGTLLQSAAETSGWENLTAVAAAVGDTSIASTSTITVTANQLAGGYALITVTPGIGYMYQIAGHAAYSAAAPTIALTDSVKVALTTSSRIDLVANPYSAVIINPATATAMPVGVAVTATPINNYGWIQVGGVANILNDGGSTVGTNVSASNGTAGAVEAAVTAQAAIGVAMTGISTTENGAIKLFGLL